MISDDDETLGWCKVWHYPMMELTVATWNQQ